MIPYLVWLTSAWAMHLWLLSLQPLLPWPLLLPLFLIPPSPASWFCLPSKRNPHTAGSGTGDGSQLLWYWPCSPLRPPRPQGARGRRCLLDPSTSFILALSESKANLTLGVLSSPESSKHMSSNSRGCHRQGCEFSKRNVVGDPEMSCWWRVHSQKTRRSLLICHQIQRLFSSQVGANCRYTGYQKRTHTFGKTEGCPLWKLNTRPLRAEAGPSVLDG